MNASNDVTNGQVVTVTVIEPDDQLFKALDAFVKGNVEQSSVYIKEAATSMKRIAGTTQKHKYAIERSADALDTLASKVAHHEVKHLHDLNYLFGKAGRALAGYRLNLLETEYFKEGEGALGASLEKIIYQLEKGISTHHRLPRRKETEILNNGLAVAGRLQKGEKISEEDLKSTLQNLNMEIAAWNTEFEGLQSSVR